MGDCPGEPNVITRVLIRGMRKGHSQRRGRAKGSRERERDVRTQEAEQERLELLCRWLGEEAARKRRCLLEAGKGEEKSYPPTPNP